MDFQLFKTKASNKLKGFPRKQEKLEQERIPGYYTAEDLRRSKEHYLHALVEAEENGWKDITRHGSIALVKEQYRVCQEWEDRALNGPVPESDFYYDLNNDPIIVKIWGEEQLKSCEDSKNQVRKYGYYKRDLYTFELYDLSWLLELKQRGLLPKAQDLYNMFTRRGDTWNTDDLIALLSRAEKGESQQEWKEHCRKYGCDRPTLFDWECKDLDWILELKRLDGHLPLSIKVRNKETGGDEWFGPEGLIRHLSSLPSTFEIGHRNFQ